MIDSWILCYLSKVVVLKLASAVLYLECRPLEMSTGAPEWDAGRDSRRNMGSLASDYESAARMSRGKKSVHIEPLNQTDVFVYASHKICEIISAT